VRGRVYHVCDKPRDGVGISFGDDATGWRGLVLPLGSIATHTPAPRAFKPGDLVTWGNGRIDYEFVAARNGLAAVWSVDHGWKINCLSDLRHADESE
jgi:hypothetical protein